MTRTRGVVLLALVVAAAGCDDGPAGGGLEREVFVRTFVDLRQATVAGTLDSVRRDSILGAHGVTEAELRAYVQARAEDPEALAATWREVLDTIAARDSVARLSDTVSAQPDTF